MPFGLVKYGFAKKPPASRHFAAPGELKPRCDVVIIDADSADSGGDFLAYHPLTDSASAGYMWMCRLDAMAEWGGAPVGLGALQDSG